jgi:hypothetical protein
MSCHPGQTAQRQDTDQKRRLLLVGRQQVALRQPLHNGPALGLSLLNQDRPAPDLPRNRAGRSASGEAINY